MIHLKQVSVPKFIEDNKIILTDTNIESGQLGELNVNIPIYTALEKEGHLIGLQIVSDDMAIGYTTITSMNGLHNSKKLIAIVDIIYIKPEFRSYKIFKEVVNQIESILKQYNIDILQIASPAKRDISKLLERINYKPLEKVYFKSLE